MQRPSTGHTVLATADSKAFSSLRARPSSRPERYAIGRALRQTVPRKRLGGWQPADDRPDPIELIIASHRGRVDDLIPVRVARMVASPYSFLRGTAVVMAHDVAGLPSTGITPVVCGDSHLGNFGFYASPEGELVIDLNDFDEAHPGLLGVGPTTVGGQCLGRRPAERRHRGCLPRRGAGLRCRIPRRGAVPGRAAAADALVQPAGSQSIARDRHREVAPARDPAVREAGPYPDQ